MAKIIPRQKHSPFYKAAITELTIGHNVTEIANYAYLKCKNLKKVDLANCVQIIGKYAFAECYNLEAIAFSTNLHTIGEGAFKNCISLRNINIPSSLTNVGPGAFAGCSNIESFSGDNVTDDGRCVVIDNMLVAFAPKGLSEYCIPEGIRKIGDYALSMFGKNEIKISFPSSLKEVGKEAFFGSNIKFEWGKFWKQGGIGEESFTYNFIQHYGLHKRVFPSND